MSRLLSPCSQLHSTHEDQDDGYARLDRVRHHGHEKSYSKQIRLLVHAPSNNDVEEQGDACNCEQNSGRCELDRQVVVLGACLRDLRLLQGAVLRRPRLELAQLQHTAVDCRPAVLLSQAEAGLGDAVDGDECWNSKKEAES